MPISRPIRIIIDTMIPQDSVAVFAERGRVCHSKPNKPVPWQPFRADPENRSMCESGNGIILGKSMVANGVANGHMMLHSEAAPDLAAMKQFLQCYISKLIILPLLSSLVIKKY